MLKVVVLAVTLTLAATAGRAWAYGVLLVPLAGAAWVHLVWLPRHGVSGWTVEPRDRYLALVTRRGARGAGPPPARAGVSARLTARDGSAWS